MSEKKTLGYMPLHYGGSYFRESLMSVIDVCDKFVILYSAKPSYGHGTTVECPETEQELLDIALEVCGDKLIWHNHQFGNEGEHRGYIHTWAKDFSLILAVDSDEIFHTEELKKALKTAYEGDKRYYGIGRNEDGSGGYYNLWRSFNFACQDGFTPVRITNLKNESGEGVVNCTIYHFSCAQSEEIMRYKLLIHGHKDEIRPDWFEKVYLAWTPETPATPDGLHLVAKGLWQATAFSKETLPEYLKSHENYSKELI